MAAGAVCARAGERGKRWRKDVVGARRCRPRPPPRCARLTLFSFERHPARTSSNDAMVVWWSCLGKTEMWRGHTGGRGGALLSSEAARRRWGGWRRRRSQEAASPPGLPARTTLHRPHSPLRQTHTTPLRQTRTQTKQSLGAHPLFHSSRRREPDVSAAGRSRVGGGPRQRPADRRGARHQVRGRSGVPTRRARQSESEKERALSLSPPLHLSFAAIQTRLHARARRVARGAGVRERSDPRSNSLRRVASSARGSRREREKGMEEREKTSSSARAPPPPPRRGPATTPSLMLDL